MTGRWGVTHQELVLQVDQSIYIDDLQLALIYIFIYIYI